MNEQKKGDNGLLENKMEEAPHMNIENVQGEVVSTDNDIHNEKVSTEPPVHGNSCSIRK